MSESAVLYEAMREIIRVTVQLEVGKATQPLHEEIRSLRGQLETRSAVAGPPGPAGERGETGPAGAPSTVPGPQGERGERGADSTVPGPKGDTGERGADGMAGRDGAPSTVPGPKGDPGDRGADGLAGRDGAPSTVPGPQGERGADGIATREEIESIVERHVVDINVRTFADIYRGVFKPGETYKRGDFATWDGSLHLALADTTDKPMTSAAWQLVTKRGRDK